MTANKEPYTSVSIKQSLALVYESYFAKLADGQNDTWRCDQRTADLFCLAQWLMDELIKHQCPQEDRIYVQGYFNRHARGEEDLYEVAAHAINSFLNGKIERYRGR